MEPNDAPEPSNYWGHGQGKGNGNPIEVVNFYQDFAHAPDDGGSVGQEDLIS